ncbi:MAG: hypothetical protein FD135_3520 [Comamonadaceae bacterium]|nr:MAG: hypothetical protein FD135_3520 [Comamonadaceae bacterium]
MRVYGVIFLALLRSSVLMLPLLGLMVVVSLCVQVFGWRFGGASGLAVLMLFLSSCVGGLLGSFSASLMSGQAWQTFPVYASRIVTVCALTGMAVSMPLLWSISEAEMMNWTHWTVWWCYGALGLGFVSGGAALYLRSVVFRWLWVVLVIMVLFWVMPNRWSRHTGFYHWGAAPLFEEIPFLSPLGLICLLVGPLSWPLLARMIAHDRQPPFVDGGSNWLTTIWNERGEWSLPFIAHRIHGRDHPQLEFLALPSSLLSLWTSAWMPVVLPIIVWLWYQLTGEPGTAVQSLKDVLREYFNVFLISSLSVLGFAPANFSPRPAGQILLLPGQPCRFSFPKWWFQRYVWIAIVGASATLLPMAGWALWLGYSPIKLLLFALFLLWAMCSCISLHFWRVPIRVQGFDLVQLGVVVVMALFLGLVDPYFLGVFSPVTCLIVMSLAFVLPWTLYQQGVKRWQRMDYGVR